MYFTCLFQLSKDFSVTEPFSEFSEKNKVVLKNKICEIDTVE